jgi:hypothetical protein
MSGETPSILIVWTHESILKYTRRIEMKIGQFIAWSLRDWATDWTSEGITFPISAVLIKCSLLPKPNRF